MPVSQTNSWTISITPKFSLHRLVTAKEHETIATVWGLNVDETVVAAKIEMRIWLWSRISLGIHLRQTILVKQGSAGAATAKQTNPNPRGFVRLHHVGV